MSAPDQLHSFVAGRFVGTSRRGDVLALDGDALPAGASDQEIEEALAEAHAVHTSGGWSMLGAEKRCQLLVKVQAQLDDALVESMAQADSAETGVPISLTRMINGSLKGAFAAQALTPIAQALAPKGQRSASGSLRQVRRPHGPAVILAPWNVPSGTVVGKLVAALVAGCPVIVKPSEVAPRGLEKFLRAVSHPNVGLPKGVLQWLHGGADVGAALVGDCRIGAIHFSGSAERVAPRPTSSAVSVATLAAKHLTPVAMECGGSNVAIVMQDADVEAAAGAIAQGVTMLNGQWCAGISRVLAHACVVDELVRKILAKFSALKVGLAQEETTEFGPLSHPAHLSRIEAICEHLRNEGGSVCRGDHPAALPTGHLFLPALVTGLPPDYAVGEIFGPCATVQSFTDNSHALQVANKKAMLQSYIFSKHADKAITFGAGLNCGSVMINGVGFGFEGVTTEDGCACEPSMGFFGLAGLGIEAGTPALAAEFFAGPQSCGVAG